jgi:hypothetical protein
MTSDVVKKPHPLTTDVSDYPSIERSFEWIDHTLTRQAAHYDVLTSRIASLFTVATAVAGIGIPLALDQGPTIQPVATPFRLIAILLLVLWIKTAIVALKGLEFRVVQALDDPQWIRKNMWRMPAERFSVVLWPIIERYYKKNLLVIREKRRAAQKLFFLTALTTGAVVAYALVAVVLRVLVG